MAASQVANLVEKAIGHGQNALTAQDVSDPAIDRSKYADPSGETMQALVWNGKNSVKVGRFSSMHSFELRTDSISEHVPKPRVVEPRDVILKVTGSTVCGSDLHLLHGENPPD